MRKILLITALTFLLIIVFIFSLYKNVVATGENPFSLKNIIVVSLFILILVSLSLLVQYLFTRYKERKAKGRNKKEIII